MAKYMKKLIAFALVLSMVAGFANISAFAAEDETKPPITVMLIPGKQTSAGSSVTNEESTTVRVVTANVSELTTVVNKMVTSDFKAPQSYLKFDRNSTADQTAQRKIRDLYTDNGHFTDPSTITVTGAPAGYPFQYVGTGDYGGHYVSHIRVIYARDEANNPIKDENGNYVIKELQHANGTPLTYKGVPTTNINGPFDQTTGTRPLQFLLKNEAGNTVYAYCIDVETGTAEGDPFYTVANLEDAGYYASEEAEKHIRAITQNGYWGTEEGTGSLTQLKAALKDAVAAGTVETEYEINFAHRKKLTDGYELQEGEVLIGSYVYWYTSEKIVLTGEVIDALTEGEALDAMQCAIWSWANGSNAALDGTDRMIVGDVTYASSALGDSRNGQNDYAGAARTKALYNYLMNLETEAGSTIVINEKNFIKDLAMTVGDEIADGVYNVSLNFTTFFNANVEKDDLTIALTYVDANGETKTITEKLTGKDALVADDNGYYTLDGLTLKAGQAFNFSLNVYGAQVLERGTYLYAAEGGFNASQTMVGIAEGINTVDVTASVDAVFAVEEQTFPPLEGEKKSELIDRDEDRYKVSIEVPGGPEAGKGHDEVILIIDGSYSGDDEWADMKKNIIQIGEKVLGGAGRTEMTVIAFGMDDNIVVEGIKSVAELETMLPELPGGLLYGRSATNCEVGFTGALKYIESKKDELSNVDVIFISDGGVNTDDTPRAFGINWQEYSTCFGAVTTAQAAFEYTLTYGTNLPAAFSVFGDRFNGMTNEQIMNAVFVDKNITVTDAEFLAFGDKVWADVYAAAGMDLEKEYPISEVEYAFAKYDEDNGTFIQDIFYWATYRSTKVTYPDLHNRTIAAANALAACPLVNELYLVRYANDGRAWWMEQVEDGNYFKADNVASLLTNLEAMLSALASTPYNNVVITDYMSKWVELDPDTIRIVDVSTNTVIWTVKEGWLIEESLRPTAQEVPVIVDRVDPSEYADGGEDVIGNTSGDIYKLTWYVKDGALLRSDNYRIEYEVTVDVAEEGFEDNENYPANGTTTLIYNDHVGQVRHVDIEVPEVSAGTIIIDDDEIPESDLPKTGDMSIVAMAAALLSMMALVSVVTIGKKKENI